MKLISPTLVFAVIFGWVDLAGKTLIFPPAALSDLVQLGPARIEVRWKPRSIPDGYFPAVEGYYVVYNHENLSLFFGPVSNEKEAIRTQNELAEIRRDLISKNPALSSSTVGRINIDFGENPPTGQTNPPPLGLQPIRVYSGDSTLELGREKEDAERGSSTTERPASSNYVIPSEPESLETVPEDGSGSASESPKDIPADGSGETISGILQGVGNNEISPESSEGGSTSEGTNNGPEDSGILKVLSQRTGTHEENSGTEQATPEMQNQTPQGELDGTETSTPSTHPQTEPPESGNSAGQSGQTQEPEMEPSPQSAEPALADAPETIAPSESLTPSGSEPDELENPPINKAGSVHINHLLKGNL